MPAQLSESHGRCHELEALLAEATQQKAVLEGDNLALMKRESDKMSDTLDAQHAMQDAYRDQEVQLKEAQATLQGLRREVRRPARDWGACLS